MPVRTVLLNVICAFVFMLPATVFADSLPGVADENTLLRVGVAEEDITPPTGFPMAGYYHERLAEGTVNSLKAKAIVFREGDTSAALVVCDLIGIANDLSTEIRKLAAAQTGIPASNIIVSATHSHTAPDYMKELFLYLGKEEQDPLRKEYIEKLIQGPVTAIVNANANAEPASLASGVANQTVPISFNRRSVMRDGSVQTWQPESNPDRLRAAGPIDPQIGLLTICDAIDGTTRGVLSNFALHCDTVGGSKWNADYPFFIERRLREELGSELISIFGTGCCGDINHIDPASSQRNQSDFIGNSIGESIRTKLGGLKPITQTHLTVKSEVVQLPLEEATEDQVERSAQTLELIKNGGKVEFLDHVLAYKKLILDQLHHQQPTGNSADYLTWGRSRSLAGIGETLPADVTVITVGDDLAIVALPGEVFVDLGLAIKQSSPFRTTIVVELANLVETIYIPHRAAYAGGSYEITNSAVLPGSGEMLVEAAVSLLRQAASENEIVKSSLANQEETSLTDENSDPTPKQSAPMIEHSVTFRLKHAPDSDEERSFLVAAAELATIPGVQEFQIRRQVSVKNSHTFGISMTFDSDEQYQAYNDHPLHVRFVSERWLGEVADFQEADFKSLD